MAAASDAGDAGGPPAAGAPSPDELPLFIMGPGPEPERLMLLARPREGTVRVREWSGHDWSSGPHERAARPEEVFREVERALETGRRLNQPAMVVRQWLFAR